ncbi:MAG: ion channel [Plesiomonas sp.]|uniref:ion channel n=1 Tax=Plesiomonas sp. TaxID=2486279 RepID=UPI003F3DC300
MIINRFENNFVLFTISIVVFLLMLGLIPIAQFEEAKLIESFSFWLLLVLSLVSLRLSPLSFKRLLFCFVFFILADVIGNHITNAAQSLRLVAMLVFMCIIFIEVSSQIFFSKESTVNRILGSLSLFLIIGIQWAIIYLFCESVAPNSFSGLQAEDNTAMFVNAIYFSFISLTSVGFGDVLPLSSMAKIIVAIEGVTGLFYMAVVVSTLVSSVQLRPEDK